MATYKNDKLNDYQVTDDDCCEHIMAKDYKGVFYGDNSEKKYFEWGAHFSYKDLHKRLNELVKRISPSRKGNETDRGERSDSKRKNLNLENHLENKYTKISETLYIDKLQKINPKFNNYLNSDTANRNIFNKQSSHLNSKKNNDHNKSNVNANNISYSNVNGIHFINNNINLTQLNVNLNVNLNNADNNSRNGNKNLEVLERISVLKNSVDKYTEEGKKKIENQILRNTINNENKSNSSSKGKTILSDRTKEVVFKKVHLNNIKGDNRVEKERGYIYYYF